MQILFNSFRHSSGYLLITIWCTIRSPLRFAICASTRCEVFTWIDDMCGWCLWWTYRKTQRIREVSYRIQGDCYENQLAIEQMWKNGRHRDEKVVSFGKIFKFQLYCLIYKTFGLTLLSSAIWSRCVDSMITTFSKQKLDELVKKLREVR